MYPAALAQIGGSEMPEIAELAREKIRLQQMLEAIAMTNFYGRSLDELTDLALKQIETRKRLIQVEREIAQYINA